MSIATALRSMLYADSERQQQAFGFTTLQNDLVSKGPRDREKGVRSGSHLSGANRQRADGHTNKHAGKQCPRQCRVDTWGQMRLGFSFSLPC